MGIDVVSPGELYTAVKAGYPMENAFFHGNSKTDFDIAFAMDNGVGWFVVDNREELDAMGDCGCTVQDVIVEHPVYGQLTGRLQLTCRADVAAFIEKVTDSAALPLSALTEGIHTHGLRCPDRQTLEKARVMLRDLQILQE